MFAVNSSEQPLRLCGQKSYDQNLRVALILSFPDMIEVETGDSVIFTIPRHFGTDTTGKVIGQGSICEVLEAADCSSGKDYAVNVMSYSNFQER
jgi:hypothetical protein